jgi:amino acid transporter
MANLKTQGLQPGLLRQLGFFSATALVISNMVGTGIFATTGFMAGDLGSARMILACWGVGALFAFAGALSYSELGINFPSSGGEYVYLTHAFGPEWGFMTGWVSFFAGFSAPIAAAALAFSDYLGYFFPSLRQANAALVVGSGAFSLRLGAGQLAACGLIAAFTMLNCFGVGRAAKVQNVLTSTKLIVIAGFVLLGFAAGSGSWSHFSEHAVRTSTVSLPAQFIVSLLWVMFGYSGWNAATYVAEEVRRPERTLPAALAAGTAIVAALYLGLNMVFIYATRLESMKGVSRHWRAFRLQPVRRQDSGRLFRADGAFHRLHRERHGDHRPASLLRDGQEQGVLPRRGVGGPALAHAGQRHPEPGPVRHAHDADAVSPTGELHRIQPDAVHGAVGGFAVRVSPRASGDGSGCARSSLPGR